MTKNISGWCVHIFFIQQVVHLKSLIKVKLTVLGSSLSSSSDDTSSISPKIASAVAGKKKYLEAKITERNKLILKNKVLYKILIVKKSVVYFVNLFDWNTKLFQREKKKTKKRKKQEWDGKIIFMWV